MQGVAGLVVMPHKTTDSRCSVDAATSTDVGVGEKDPASSSKPTTEGKVTADLVEKFLIVNQVITELEKDAKLKLDCILSP